MSLPPGSRAPAFVQMLQWLRSPGGSLEASFRRFGETFTIHSPVFGTEVVITRPDTLKQVFTGDPDVLHAGEGNSFLATIVGNRSVLLLDGKEHLRQRRLMLPAFHGERMQHYVETMRDVTAQTSTRWGAGERLGMHTVMQRVTMDIILRAVLGLEAEHEIRPVRDQLTRLLDRTQSPFGMLWLIPALQRDLGPLTPWASIRDVLEETDALLLAHIARRRERDASRRADDVLQMLIEAVDDEGQKMTDRELRDELMTLLLAGHETTATSIAWAFEEILRVPGEQERLAAEVLGVTGGAPLVAEHLPRLERLDSVIKETLRLHPATAAVARRLKKPLTLEGYDLDPGVLIVPCMHLTHRRPELYPDPDRFEPTRFIGKKPDPYEWLPFGGGSRRCLGMVFALQEMKVVLAQVLSSVRLRLARPAPLETTLRSFVYAPKGGTWTVMEGKRS